MKRFTTPLSPDDLTVIADCLCNGGIVLMPTDTVYGIAAHVDRPDARQRIVSMKGRDPAKPLPLLAGSAEAVAGSGLAFSARARKVAACFWPGALTLVLDASGDGTEGVRVPDDATACAICEAAGGLLRCTSANASGDPPALDAGAAAAAIPDADMLVDGGPVKGGIASTVVRITDGTTQFFRVGGISEADILACAGPERATSAGTPVRSGRILTATEMRAERDRLHAEGKKLVFTNGCFDILHTGHITYLRFAREQGDALCVGLNSDASVQRNKGPLRPVVNEQDRAALLTALRCVDYVVRFDEEEPRALIEKILPDVLVKGRDWAHYVSGRDVVEAHGGHVVLADLVEGRSTTDIIGKISAAHRP